MSCPIINKEIIVCQPLYKYTVYNKEITVSLLILIVNKTDTSILEHSSIFGNVWPVIFVFVRGSSGCHFGSYPEASSIS